MKLPYRESDWFAVPLREGGFAVGLVARASKKGRVLLGYFFGPRRESVPRLEDLEDLTAKDALRVLRFGDLSLLSGEWPILGHFPVWSRSDWPMPEFARKDELSGKTWRVVYSEDDPNKVVSEVPLSQYDEELDRDAVSGAGAVELVLTKLLAG